MTVYNSYMKISAGVLRVGVESFYIMRYSNKAVMHSNKTVKIIYDWIWENQPLCHI